VQKICKVTKKNDKKNFLFEIHLLSSHKFFIYSSLNFQIMTVETAIAQLSQVQSVEEWNEVREQIKNEVNDHIVWVRDFVPEIDCKGLIVKVLG
jgi:hypothetical protein